MTTPKDLLRELGAAMERAGSAIVQIAHVYKAGLDASPDWRETVRNHYTAIPLTFWSNIERVATGRLLPGFVAMSVPRIDLIAQLSLPDQQEIIAKGVRIYAGGVDERLVPIDRMSEGEIKRVIKFGRVLTVDEQAKEAREKNEKAHKERVRERNLSDDQPIKYRIRHGKLTLIKVPLTLSKDELRLILDEMEDA